MTPKLRMTQRRTMLNAARVKAEHGIESVITPLFSRRFSALKRELRQGNLRKRLRKSADILRKDDGSKWQEWIDAFQADVMKEFESVIDELGAVENTFWESRGEVPAVWDSHKVAEQYQQRIGRMIKQIASDTLTDTQNKITDWFNSERTLPELIAELEPLFGAARARMIAITEATGLAAQVSGEMMRHFGVTQWKWDAFNDGIVCSDCLDMNGVTFSEADIDNYPPLHPNCLLGDSLVLPIGHVAGASKRWYEGNIIVISTGENNLTVTPNHPVLTNRGWVAAGELNQTDYVMSYRGGEREKFFIDSHEDNMVASIENIFSSIGFGGFRVPTTAPDFHGDGANSEVAIIRPNSKVTDSFKTISAEPLRQGYFVSRNVISDISLPGLGPRNQFIASDNPAPRSIVSGSDLFGSLGVTHSAPLHELGFGLASWLDTRIDDVSSNNGSADPETFSKLIFGITGMITAQKIVNIRNQFFSGHVYNLQSESGLYVANGIITHNCRCGQTFILEDEAQ